MNLGFIASIGENRFEAMFELIIFQWVNFGVRYKIKQKKQNWSEWIFTVAEWGA